MTLSRLTKAVTAALTVCWLVCCGTGCSSVRGYRVTVNGETVKKADVGGLPITVTTPEYAVFVATITRCRVPVFEEGEDAKPKGYTDVAEVALSEKPFIFGPTELFAIDPRRPFAGKAEYSFELENQYPKKLAGKVEDTTLTQVRELLSDLAAKAMGVAKQAGEVVRAGMPERQVVDTQVKLVVFELRTGKVCLYDLATGKKQDIASRTPAP